MSRVNLKVTHNSKLIEDIELRTAPIGRNYHGIQVDFEHEEEQKGDLKIAVDLLESKFKPGQHFTIVFGKDDSYKIIGHHEAI